MNPKRATLLALLLFGLLAFGVGGVLAVTYIDDLTGSVPIWLNPGWRFYAKSDTVPGEAICVEVHPVVVAPGNYVQQECSLTGAGGEGGYEYQCDVFTGGVPAAFKGLTVEYQYFIADTGTGCTSNPNNNTSFAWLFATDVNGSPLPLAVQLAGFNAVAGDEQIRVTWETNSEQGNQGFNLLRGTSDAAPDRQLNEALIASQAPDSSDGFSYEWLDRAVQSGATYYYWLEAVDVNGTTQRFGPVSAAAQVPTAVIASDLASSSSRVLNWHWIALGLAALGTVFYLRGKQHA